ncbi:MAG: hypothetical protein FWC96_05095 [Oscillospiraceae bacterium]|nr:hypothetical protein [Oscillospiraceae bacterium]
MASDFKKVADEFLKSPAGSKIKKDEFGKLMASSDGKKVKQMLESGDDDLMSAVRKGDMDSLKNTLSKVLATEEGARLAGQIVKMIK